MTYKNLNNMENNSFGTLLDVIPFSTYAVDIQTYNIVYINKVLAKKISSSAEKFCWKKIYGQNEKCSWCTITKLTNEKKIISTFFDESSDVWLQTYDELVTWPNGRIIKCTIAVDITDQKEMQSSLIQTHARLVMHAKKLKQVSQKYELLSKTDYLTGINNRINFFYLGTIFYKNNLVGEKEVFISIFDINNFKQLNVLYGPLSCDKLLIAFAREVEKHIDSRIDIFARIGSDEFALIISSSFSNDIFTKIECIRKSLIYKINLIEELTEIAFTVSVGTVRRNVNESLYKTFERTNRLLYEAKNSGKNQAKFEL